MPNLSKNAEIAQYYTFAYQNEANAHLGVEIEYLIDALQDSVDTREIPSNLEKGLLRSLKDFKQYCKYAAEDINNGIRKSPNLAAASNEMKRILKGFDTMKTNDPSRYTIYETIHDTFVEKSKVMTAAQWIEQAKQDCLSGKIDGFTAVKTIFAVRNLADAQRGNRANLDKTILDPETIEVKMKYFGAEGAFEQFWLANDDKLVNMLDKIGTRDHGGKMEELFKDYALNKKGSLEWNDDLFGRLKPDAAKQEEHLRKKADEAKKKRLAGSPTAAKKIEAIQRNIKANTKPVKMTKYDDEGEPYEVEVKLAQENTSLRRWAQQILGVRIMADAERGNRKNLDKTRIHEDDFEEKAMQLHGTGVVGDFIDKMLDDATKVARDKRLQEILEANPTVDPKDPRIKKELKKVQGQLDMKLFTDGHGGKLEEKFEEYLKTREDYKDLDPEIFGKYAPKSRLVDDFEVIGHEDIPGPDPVDAQGRPVYSGYGDFFQKNKTNADGTVSKLYHAAKMAAADDLRRNKPDNQFDRKVLENKAKQYLKDPNFKLLMRDEKLRDKVCGGDTQALAMAARKLKETIPGDLSDVAPSTDTLNKLDGVYDVIEKNSHSNIEQLDPKVQEKLTDLQHKLLNLGKYTDASYDDEKDPENIRGQIEKLSGRVTDRTIIKMREENRKAGGDDYRKLVENARELYFGNPTDQDYLNVINGVLDYQDAHLGDTNPETKQRVDSTMALLGEITAGTGMNYLEQQIAKVNEARGLKAGDPGFLKKADFEPERDEDEMEADGAEREANLDIAEKLKKFSFLNGDGNDDEKEEEQPDLNESREEEAVFI